MVLPFRERAGNLNCTAYPFEILLTQVFLPQYSATEDYLGIMESLVSILQQFASFDTFKKNFSNWLLAVPNVLNTNFTIHLRNKLSNPLLFHHFI